MSGMHSGLAQLVYPDGKVRYMHWSWFSINSEASKEVARLKPLSLTFMREAGISVPEFEAFFFNAWAEEHGTTRNEDAAAEYADRLGYPVILKPSSKSQGKGVKLVGSRQHLLSSLPSLVRIDPMFVIQRYVTGTEFRVVVFDGAVHLAWTKAPLTVVGDGDKDIRKLVDARVAEMQAVGLHVETARAAPGIDSFLAAKGLTMASVPAAGAAVQVGVAAGYLMGGVLAEGLHLLPERVRQAAIEITRLAGLRLAGLDIIVPPEGGPDPEPYYLIEINAGPSFEGYLKTGPDATAKVEALAERILLAMNETLP